jgi:hypothetical protein
MLNFIKQNTSLSIFFGAGIIFIAAAWWQHRNSSANPPKQWREVGTLSNLWCYPIKSCGPIELKSAECVVLGVKHDNIRDRYMNSVVRQNYDCLCHPLVEEAYWWYPLKIFWVVENINIILPPPPIKLTII